MSVTILGIRHHGVGSAKNVLEMLQKLQPDMVFVEGPPELDVLSRWVGEKTLKPPIAALCYDQDAPQRAVFYPYSEFSPEWQTILYANKQKIPVRMMDLPVAISWEMAKLKTEKTQNKAQNTEGVGEEQEAAMPIHKDPISYFAEIAGYSDSDMWWEHHFEQRYIAKSAEAHFEAVMLTMQTLREEGTPSVLDEENVYREAYMGHLIRQAQREMYQNIVVVCGAWHAPALLNLEKTEAEHAKIVKKLPKTKIKVGTTWIPWTNDRLSFRSGYGAGIHSPGWYSHLWHHPKDNGAIWLANVARLFRKKKMDISTAHVIEALRLSESLASLRDLPKPSLWELNEATQTVMCMGDAILLELVKKELIVGHALGKVPSELPKLPLQNDFEELVRKLRLSQTAEKKDIELDLRKDLDLNRSIFLYRLKILNIEWGKQAYARSKGTFKEVWTLAWSPEMLVNLIEKGIWGNTIIEASSKFLLDKAANSQSISHLSDMIQQAIPAELFEAIEVLLLKINELATISADIMELMAAIVPLADVGRYGNVRKSDLTAINALVEGMIVRISIGLPTAAYGLDDEASQKMFDLIRKVNDSVRLVENEALTEMWFKTLAILVDKEGIHPIVQGCTCRLLCDAKVLDTEGVSIKFGLALSTGNAPDYSAGWIEGFLKGSGMILLYDDTLWNLLYKWVSELTDEAFMQLIPILRRTFSKFDVGERRHLGEKAKRGVVFAQNHITQDLENEYFNYELADKSLGLVAQLLGLV
ncbi:MAG: hypothetical protein JNL70_02325 [Saprospiraceae bacterium]|nr:hypothetical protein [Saprospiraceae bacterium]